MGRVDLSLKVWGADFDEIEDLLRALVAAGRLPEPMVTSVTGVHRNNVGSNCT